MTILFDKMYDGESMYDLDRDISEAMCEDYNAALGKLPRDEYGFIQGTFHVRVKWLPE